MKPEKSGAIHCGTPSSAPRTRWKSPKKTSASGMLTAGGITSRVFDMGWA